jgi:hypothetical protein
MLWQPITPIRIKVPANWNIPLTQSRSFFTDLIQRLLKPT